MEMKREKSSWIGLGSCVYVSVTRYGHVHLLPLYANFPYKSGHSKARQANATDQAPNEAVRMAIII